jgi:hypothetical protein
LRHVDSRERIVVLVSAPDDAVHRRVTHDALRELFDVSALARVDRAERTGVCSRDHADERLRSRAGAGLDRLDEIGELVRVQLVDERAVQVAAVQRFSD